MIDNKLKFKQRPVSTSSSKNKATISTSSKEKVNKIRGKKSEIKKEVTKFISEVEKVSSKKKSNSDPKEKKNLRQNFVRANLKGHYVEKKRVRPINIRKYKLNKGRAFYKSQEKVNMSDSNYMGNGDKGVDIDNKQIIDENISEKVPVFSEGFIVDKKEDITPNKNVITTRLTTALKSSLRKCVPLDTELKFLSKEFRYLLSDKKEEIEKLNQIKEEELHKKLTYTPIRREVTMESYPMPEENSQSNYGNMRHACADRGVCYLEPSIFYIPNMDLEVVYYYCEACNTLYYSKAQTSMEAQQRRETLRYNNTLIKQQEREQTRMMKEYNRNLVRNYKAMEREQNRMWKEQLRMYNQKSY